MAIKTYTHDDVTLVVETMAKKTHYFYQEGNDKPVALLNIDRKGETINLICQELDNEELYNKVAKCYNQFINKNPKIKHYELNAGQTNGITEHSIVAKCYNQFINNKIKHYELNAGQTNGITEHSIESFPFVIYGIKKELNSSINLVTKEQIDELDEKGIPYYNYYNNSFIKGLSHKNKNILMNIHNTVVISDNDFFKDHVVNIYSANQKSRPIPYDSLNPKFNLTPGSYPDSFDKTKPSYVPALNILDRDENGHMSEIDSHRPKKKHLILNYLFGREPLNLSNIKAEEIYLHNHFFDRKNLLKTLDTLEDKDNKKIFLGTKYVEKLGIPYDKKYELYANQEFKCSDLINELSNGKEISLDR